MPEVSLIAKILIFVIPIMFAITVHEVAHGWVANKLGDPTAKMLGRLTLNPIKHIDPIGTVVVPLVLLFLSAGFIFGWAKPVPVNWNNLRNQRRDIALVAAAGPGVNLLMALIWAAIGKLAINLGSTILLMMCFYGIVINMVLMILNLIPLPPLDGSRIVTPLLPPKAAYAYNRLEPYGFLILIGLLVFGILQQILGPPVFASTHVILNLFGLTPALR